MIGGGGVCTHGCGDSISSWGHQVTGLKGQPGLWGDDDIPLIRGIMGEVM